MDTNILTQSLDTLKSTITGMITGKECTELNGVKLYKLDKNGVNQPVLGTKKSKYAEIGEQIYVEFPPTQFNLEIDWTGFGTVDKWLSQFVNPQASIRWANKVRPNGLEFVKANQKINAVDFFVKQIGFGGDANTRATNAVDKIDDLNDLEALQAKIEARIKSKKSAN